jgi:hypothetical protein
MPEETRMWLIPGSNEPSRSGMALSLSFLTIPMNMSGSLRRKDIRIC